MYIPDMYLDALGKKVYTGKPLTESEIEFLKKNYQKMLNDPDTKLGFDEIEAALLEDLERKMCFTPQIFARKSLKLIRRLKAILGVSAVLAFLIWMFI